MGKTLTLDLPDDVADRLDSLLPEAERISFSIAAIADALAFREEEDCVTVVEQALADMDQGRGLISFEELCRQWDEEKSARNSSSDQ